MVQQNIPHDRKECIKTVLYALGALIGLKVYKHPSSRKYHSLRSSYVLNHFSRLYHCAIRKGFSKIRSIYLTVCLNYTV